MFAVMFAGLPIDDSRNKNHETTLWIDQKCLTRRLGDFRLASRH